MFPGVYNDQHPAEPEREFQPLLMCQERLQVTYHISPSAVNIPLPSMG